LEENSIKPEASHSLVVHQIDDQKSSKINLLWISTCISYDFYYCNSCPNPLPLPKFNKRNDGIPRESAKSKVSF
jgi:hypothetical protein